MPTLPIKNPTADYKTCPRAFGCRREQGRRKHAGVDLYAPVGTPVLATEDCHVVRDLYSFYLGTYAIEVKTASGQIIRYGEIQANTPRKLKIGDKISEGEVIGFVGKLQGLSFSMLHFEMYSGKEEGRLTNTSNLPYQRRLDLIDPTPYLDSCKKEKNES